MRYSLLNFIYCPFCRGDLTWAALKEIKIDFNDTFDVFSYQLNKKGAFIGPVPHFKKNTSLTKILTKHACSPDPLEMDNTADIIKGLLICGECRHWYPILNFVPELLPDHLRDWEKDIKFLSEFSDHLPSKLYKILLKKTKSFRAQKNKTQDETQDYKKAEISIKDKVADKDFFGPGYSSPFNKDNPEFTQNLIIRFSSVLPFLQLKQNNVVLDVGSGYSWTTEWLLKMGFESIGVDICRKYIDVGIKRMRNIRPHLIVADIENLPIKDTCLNSILCYDAFHHIANRKKAVAHFFRALKENGPVVLAEPGREHEHAQASIDVMEKYGILEKGIETDDLKAYCEGLDFSPPEQYFVLKTSQKEKRKMLTTDFINSHSFVDCNIYVLRKSAGKEKVGIE